MGVVYRAHDEHLDCDVALKVLPAGNLADDAARKRFRREALALSKLNHPNIAIVHDFDSQDGTDFLVEELIPGLSLSEMLTSGPLAEREIVHLGSQLADGLAAAHSQGVIHRDLKPGNLRVTPDARLKILDFGLARVVHPHSPTALTASETQTSSLAGTLPYMAPEQLLAEKIDARVDIWAVGCVLYEMATGRSPFHGSGAALIDAILHRAAPAASKLNPRISPGLEAIILKCLEKDPGLRYASAGEIAVDLHRLLSSASIRAVAQPRRFRTHSFVIASTFIGVLAVVVGMVVLSRLTPHRTVSNAPQPSQVPASIAVLPFADMSPGRDQEYFSDGLAEELLNDLAKIPGVQVTARTSSFQFKGKNVDLSVIGKKLNVATVLEGSVRKQGNRVRITAQLIKVSDGFHLWSEIYDKDMTDVFAVQEEIARSVAASLKVTLLGVTTRWSRTTSPEAYSAYLQAQYFRRQNTKDGWNKAVSYYRQAIKLDPGYAPAWAGLAEALRLQATAFGDIPLHAGLREARESAARALALDANLAEAHAALGFIKKNYDWDWAGADASFQRALSLEPGNVLVLWGAADFAATLGHWDEALRLAGRIVELNPLEAEAYRNLGYLCWRTGRRAEAVAALQKALEFNPEGWIQHFELSLVYLTMSRPHEALAEAEREEHPIFRLQALAVAYYALGRKQESNRALSELIQKYQVDSPFQVAEVYAFRGEVDLALQWLERAYVERDGGLTVMKGDPLLHNLESDPRYIAFLRKMHLSLN